jgi:hypothetical protein
LSEGDSDCNSGREGICFLKVLLVSIFARNKIIANIETSPEIYRIVLLLLIIFR